MQQVVSKNKEKTNDTTIWKNIRNMLCEGTAEEYILSETFWGNGNFLYIDRVTVVYIS